MTKRMIPFVAVFLLILSLIFVGCAGNTDDTLITSYTELKSAVSEAAEGAVILVGDIDFSPTSPNIPNSLMNIEIKKNITLKNGKRDGEAVFTNGGFLLVGSKASDEKIVCRFEGIVFDGKTDQAALTQQDYQYPWSEAEQTYTFFAPLKAQQAFSFKGNVDAEFSGCVFKNYMHEYGPIIDIRYGDYTDNAYLLDLFGDHSGCRIQLDFDTCRIENNSALYDGGAIYIDSNHNVTLNAKNCTFSENRSTVGEFSRGGGAIYAVGATLNFTGCMLEENIANHVFEDSVLSDYDTHKGGAILLENGKLSMRNTTVKNNRASMGGGLSMTNVKADIDGCRFLGNRAEAYASNPDHVIGPWSNMSQGGAMYVEGNSNDTVSLVNCEIKDNSAANAYGGIYGYYSPHEDMSLGTYFVKMNLCTYENNRSDVRYDYTVTEQFPWASHPGDMFVNPHLTMFGCYVTDETFETDFPHQDAPTAENGYNYLSAEADEEMRAFSVPTSDAQKVLAGRYGDQLKRVHIGSNYDEALYREEGENTLVWWFIGAVLLLAIGVGVILVLRRKMASSANDETSVSEPSMPAVPETVIAPERKIVMTRYTDEKIDRFLTLVPETQLLTGRELEVLREILRGKKQGEVAHYLGIEVTTVKDFYKKIYTKLNVSNKDGLFIKAADVLKNES